MTLPDFPDKMTHTKHEKSMVYLENIMTLVKKTIELDQEQINRIKSALNAKSEKEAINSVLTQFDTEIQLAEVTLRGAGTFDFAEI